MKIGIDFGSTYSTVSKYNELDDTVEALHLEEGAPVSIPSAVSVSLDGSVACGDAAKSHAGNPAYQVYDGFKMLLVETDQDIVKNKKYTGEYTPRVVTRLYLEDMLQGVQRRFGKNDEAFDEIYICIPEIWSSRISTLDGRNILKDIIEHDISGIQVKNINVVTEPEAASAFFSHNYERETGKTFNGHLLLIDYGGGTLDITLTQVMSDGKGRMEIAYREGGGIGENHPDQNGHIAIGNAGLAYMQQVLLYALRDKGVEDPDCSNIKFKKAIFALEKELKSVTGIKKIEDRFSEYSFFSDFDLILEEAPETVAYIEYMDDILPITYQHLWSAYRDAIKDKLADELAAINKKVSKHIGADPASPKAGARDDFKIALVGGFGSFYFVRKQINEIYNITANSKNDKRIKNIRLDKGEQAISLGAALLASGRVVLQKTARYSIGLCTRRSTDKKRSLGYGIFYHQQLKVNVPYYICNPNTGKRNTYTSLKNNLNEFAIGFSESMDRFTPLPLKPEFYRRLSNLPAEKMWYIGFSLDESDILSVHISPYDEDDEPMVITLDSYANMFDLTAVEEVSVDDI